MLATIRRHANAHQLKEGNRFIAPVGAIVDEHPIAEPETFRVDDEPIVDNGRVYVPVSYPPAAADLEPEAGCVELPADAVVALLDGRRRREDIPA
ncbi:hypothetical protein [Actinophytocola sp.]|uniref:hypothetical protein n=1 Tax=Actinophytocola sp. TaxID=1872138 RepID=UPI002D2F4E8C|nr:hypothetical protein [Actinophytocola sp.]HYQ62541.1 hypothetical protein [Actinophytocola sp.]